MANKKFNSEQIGEICTLIFGWRRKPFTWDLIVLRVKADLDIDVSRPTLSDSKKYPDIQHAYHIKKQSFRDKPKDIAISLTPSDKSLHQQLVDARSKIEKLESKIEYLEVHRNNIVAVISAIKDNAKNNPVLLQVLNDTLKELS